MRDMYSWSTSDDWSRESSVAAGAALDGRSSLVVVAALVGVAEDRSVEDAGWTGGDWTEVGVALVGVPEVLEGGVVIEDWSVEDAGWTGGDWTEVGVASVGVDADAEWLPVADG